jgi:glycosyltransferase involved in cell wall biosynthesis
MKLLYIANIRIPTEKAHGHQIFQMCDQYVSLGCELELLVAKRKNNIKEDPFLYYKSKNKFNISYINSFDFLSLISYLGKKSFYLQHLFFLIFLFFRKIKKDKIIITRSSAIAFVMHLKGCRVFFECHDWLGGKMQVLKLFFLRGVDGIIVTNNFIKGQFIQNNFNEKNILVSPNGVDLEVFELEITKEEAIKKLNLNQDFCNRIILMYTGSYRTMGVEKGLLDIMHALTLLSDNYFFIAIGGSDVDIKYYQNIVNNLNISHKVLLLEKQDQKILAIYQKAANILLMPFPDLVHYKFFMSPLKTFEYMASQRPIIASSLPSIKEILDKDICFFVEPNNQIQLKERIEEVAKNEYLSNNKAFLAKERVRCYTWTARAKGIVNFIKFLSFDK